LKELAKQVKGKAFPGWQKNRSVMKEIEEIVFDVCFERFSSHRPHHFVGSFRKAFGIMQNQLPEATLSHVRTFEYFAVAEASLLQ